MNKRPLVACLAALLLGAAVVAADDLSVIVDPKTDFSAFKTFALRDQKIGSPRPELNNSLFAKKLSTTIRAALVERGLKEDARNPDMMVDYVLTGEDFSLSARGLVRGAGPRPVQYTEGTLVIDLSRPNDTIPVWRGTYRDDENTGSKLMLKLPEDAKKLLARYPQRSK